MAASNLIMASSRRTHDAMEGPLSVATKLFFGRRLPESRQPAYCVSAIQVPTQSQRSLEFAQFCTVLAVQQFCTLCWWDIKTSASPRPRRGSAALARGSSRSSARFTMGLNNSMTSEPAALAAP